MTFLSFSKRDKLKVLMIQLPVSVFSLQKSWGNLPLAAGFLSAMASKSDLAGRLDIEILDVASANLSADAIMIDLIISKAPDILCFSLYSWNSLRSLYIAREVKKTLPKVRIIVGGPEVTAKETEYVKNDPTVDIGCIGEGEFAFIDIMRSLLSGNKEYKNIDGIFYRYGSRVVTTSPRRYNRDTDSIPSPYLSKVIDAAEYGCIWIETRRGCAGSCSYCSENLRPVRIFSAKRICKELKMAVDKKVTIYFIESDFVSSPHFREIFQYLKKINRNKERLSISGDTCAENLSEETVELLKEAGVKNIEVGLQSTNPDTLRNIRRPVKLQKFLKGVNLLKEKKIGLRADIIIGLPEDTLENFRTTLRFLKERDLKPNAFILKVEPCTQIRKEAKRYKINYQKRPPYCILAAPYISSKEIKEGFWEALAASETEKKKLYFLESMASYSAYNYLREDNRYNLSDLDEKEKLKGPINKIVIDLDSSPVKTAALKSAGARVARLVSQPLTVWLKAKELVKNFESIKSFLVPIAAANPFLLWNIVLETSESFPISAIRKIVKDIPSREEPPTHVDSPYRFCAVFPWRGCRIKRSWLAAFSRRAPFYWSIVFSKKDRWEADIEKLFKEQYNIGFLIDFDSSCDINFIIKISKALFERESEDKGRSVTFRNYALNQIIPVLREKNKGEEKADAVPRVVEFMLVLDKDLDISPLSRLANTPDLDSVRWLMDFKKVLKGSGELKESENRIIKRVLRLGSYYEETKECNKALRLYKELLKFFDSNSEIHLALGRAYFNLKKYKEATGAAEKAIELGHKKDEANLLLGFCYSKNRQYRRAIEKLNQAKKIKGTGSAVNFCLFECYRNTGELEKADIELKETLIKIKKSR